MQSVQAIIRAEFLKFRKAIRADMERIVEDIQKITKRLDEVESRLSSLPVVSEEDIISEI